MYGSLVGERQKQAERLKEHLRDSECTRVEHLTGALFTIERARSDARHGPRAGGAGARQGRREGGHSAARVRRGRKRRADPFPESSYEPPPPCI